MASQEQVATLLKIVTPPGYCDDRSHGEDGSRGSEVGRSEEERGVEGRVGLVQVCEEGEGGRGDSREGGGEKEGGEEGVYGGDEGERGEERMSKSPNHATVTPSSPGGKEEEEEEEKEENEITSSSSNSIPGAGGLSVVHTTLPASGTAWGQSPITLDNLPPTSPVTPGRPPNPAMGWWAEALAETQDMEDIDALVEQLEVRGRRRERSGGGGEEEEEGEDGEDGEGKRTETSGVTAERGVSSIGGGGGRGENGEGKGGIAGVLRLSAESEDGRRRRVEAGEEEEVSEEEGMIPTLGIPREGQTMRNEGGVSSVAGGLNQTGRSPASSRDSLDSLGLERRENSVRSSRSPSPSSQSSSAAAGDKSSRSTAYIVQAGRLIRLALQYEEDTEYEEAFDLFKAAVDVLLNGVQSECACTHAVEVINSHTFTCIIMITYKFTSTCS